MSILSAIGSIFNSVPGSNIVGSGLGLIGSIANNQAQKKMNEQNIAMQRETNALQYKMMQEQNEFNRQQAIDMFNLENQYNSPLEQVKRLQDAGLNPAMMMDNGQMVNSGDASTPIGANVPSLTAPQVQKVPPLSIGFLDALNTLSQTLLNTKKAGESGANTKRIQELLPNEVEKVLAEINNEKASAAYTNLQTFLDQVFSPFQRNAQIKKIGEEIQEISKNAALATLRGETEKSDKLLKDAQTELQKSQNEQLNKQLPLIIQQLHQTISLLQEQVKTEKSKQSLNYASAENQQEQARDTRETRESRIAVNESVERLNKSMRELNNTRNSFETQTLQARIGREFEELSQSELLTEMQRYDLQTAKSKMEQAMYANDMKKWTYWKDYGCDILNSVSGVVRAVK